MAIQLLKEDVKTTQVICQKYSQTMVESDVIVPDIKPDIKKVLEVSGNACITQKMIQQDKAFIQGTIKFNVLYLPDGEETVQLKNLSLTQEFNHVVDCRGAQPDMQLSAEAEPESFDHTLINSRKLNLRCVMGIGIKIARPALLSLTTGAEGENHIALRKERLRLCGGTDTAECQIIIREQLELPAGKPAMDEVLKITAVPVSTELCMMDNKAVAKGQLRICTLYSGQESGSSVEFMEHVLPFTEILDVSGSTEGMGGEIDYTVGELYYEIRDDTDGEPRALGIELVLTAAVKGCETMELETVSDAYSLCGKLDLTTRAYRLEQLLDNNTAEVSFQDQAQLPPMLPKLKQVCDVSTTARIERIAVEEQQITVFGTVHSNILYLTADQDIPISSFGHISEFTHSFTVPGAGGDTACDARIFPEHVSYTLSGDDSLELRFVLGLTVKSLKTGEVLLVEEMTETTPSEDDSDPRIVLYFVQSGDTLWDIAKRYRTTVQALQTLNRLDGDLLHPGQQIKILSGMENNIAG